MFSRALITLSFMTAAFAVPTTDLSGRENSPNDADLLASCPGGPGSSNVERADRCTLINIVNNPDTRVYKALGDPQLNCGGGTDEVKVTLGGSTEVSQTVTVSANLGINVEGISVGGGISTTDTSTETQSKTVEYSIPPGRQAVFVTGIDHRSQTGNVKVNYGDRQFDHFIWFTGTTITQLTPTDDVVFDVYESACGTDPNDFSSLH
ncbi:uncharacterized protein BXZ73DRAFT_43795 [Epithele typhae]|uniref:uncharacterized protein n=1 Tax=Epithele typhae TaxID=378194 RepID=UPI002007636C|nr:uncharacterized protein BXZ73DRAFT_43795 [Epithele typhae]KAH9939355.1 hypothetical protein BXZ73DRAFT_43795 [Epithele typhae]